MKTSIWDILTGIVLLGILCLIAGFMAVALNPRSALNPFKPGQPTLVAQISLPTATEQPRQLPPTWTPSPLAVDNRPVDVEPAPADTLVPSGQLRETSTPLPTNTMLVLPTFTATRAVGSSVGGGSCSIVYQSPEDGAFFKPGESLGDVRWTIKNTSSKEWRGDSVDIRYMPSAGEKAFHNANNLLDLAYGVQPGSMIDVTIPMTAPTDPAVYTSNWGLVEGNKVLCRFYVIITVR